MYQTTASITPLDFKAKWSRAGFNEQQGAQEFFLDLCGLVGHLTPAEVNDPENFTLEKRIPVGRADAYKADFFGWEFKGNSAKLPDAFNQLLQYQVYLRTPPLLVVSSFDAIRVQTNFRNLETVVYDIPVSEIDDARHLSVLRYLFHDPDQLRPQRTTARVTADTAELFHLVVQDMERQTPPPDPEKLAKFINRIIFCFYAASANLGLSSDTMTRMMQNFHRDPDGFDESISSLFETMRRGGVYGADKVAHFNGDLFADKETVWLSTVALERLAEASRQSWNDIDPSIFGAMLEHILDRAQRKPLGVHYTTVDDIMLVIEPTLLRPLRREWKKAREEASQLFANDARGDAFVVVDGFRRRLTSIKVLDPACGSGNFLFVALKSLLDLEKEVILFLAEHGWRNEMPTVHPRQFLGIEINPYAVELARTALRIGYIQWHQANGFKYERQPILATLDTIRLGDALLEQDSKGQYHPATWPEAEFITGNPAFLGAAKMLVMLGDEYTYRLRQVYQGRVLPKADLCCYWFENAQQMIVEGKAKRAGLLATNAIRYESNRDTLRRIRGNGQIFAAYDDRLWKPDEPGSAGVQVSIVCFDDGSEIDKSLNDHPATDIDARLMDNVHLDRAVRLKENEGFCVRGFDKGGKFDLPSGEAKAMLLANNPNGCPNGDVITPYLTGRDLNGKPAGRYVIDFGALPEADAELYELPYDHLLVNVKPVRQGNREDRTRERWWQLRRSGEDVKTAIAALSRYIATSQVSKHRYFQFVPSVVKPDGSVVVIASDDDYVLGILESRIHKVWALAAGTQLVSGPRYIISECFDKFPFPEPDAVYRQAVADAALELDQKRQNACFPKGGFQMSMTRLYNVNPGWLQRAHRKLDKAVADAYGWSVALDDSAILQRLVQLNIQRSNASQASTTP